VKPPGGCAGVKPVSTQGHEAHSNKEITMTQTITTITTWTETIDALRERDKRLNAAAACPLSPFPTVSNGFTIATSFLYDAQRVAEGEKPISHGRESETAETLLASAREWARSKRCLR
jgi:hypothetical protein